MNQTASVTATVPDLIAQVWSSRFALHLDPEDMCFLVGIHAFLMHSEDATLDESHLREIFPIVSEVSHGDPSTVAQRCTRATARLTEQDLLIRTDLAGVVREGEYSLTQLGKAIAEWVTKREALNSDDLQVMMTHVRAGLAEVKEDALRGGDDRHWQSRVAGPLKLTVTGIVEMIDQRRRGLDIEHAEIRKKIASMLEQDWFRAIDSCEALLERTSETLQELHRVLSEEVETTTELLAEIEELAHSADRVELQRPIREVSIHMEQLNAWGTERLSSWSDFYQRVHVYIRSVVQFDPDRAIRHRLRDAIRTFGSPSWGLCVAEPLDYLGLRDIEAREGELRVQRPAEERSCEIEEIVFEPSLFDRVRERLDQEFVYRDEVAFSSILRDLLPAVGRDDLYGIAGKLIERLLQTGEVVGTRGWEWTPVDDGLEVQDFIVRRDRPLRELSKSDGERP